MPAPRLALGLGEKLGARAAGITNIEGVLQFMMDTAVETKQISEEYRDAQLETNRLLREVIETLQAAIVGKEVDEATG